jgi:GNAT superfamily N-acetyltransferase
LALFDDDLDVVAAAHIVRARDDDLAEFAFSVDREWRSCGVGCELFNRTVLWARNRGIRQAILYCLYENQTIRQLARQAGVQMTVHAGEIEGRLELLPATPLSFLAEHTSECLAWFCLSLKLVGWLGFHQSCGLRLEPPAGAHPIDVSTS